MSEIFTGQVVFQLAQPPAVVVQQSQPVSLVVQTGLQGIQGIQGPKGDPGDVPDFDPGDLTLVFYNQLI